MSSLFTHPALKPGLLTVGLMALVGCAESFERTVYDLEAPRILGIQSQAQSLEPGQPYSASLFAYQGTLYPQGGDLNFHWYLPPHGDMEMGLKTEIESIATAGDFIYLGTGPDLHFTPEATEIQRAENDDGHVLLMVAMVGDFGDGAIDERAFITLNRGDTPNQNPEIHGLTRAELADISFQSADESLNADLFTDPFRRQLQGIEGAPYSTPGAALRLAFTTSDPEGDPLSAQLFASHGAGTALPLDASLIDWLSGTLLPAEDPSKVNLEALASGSYHFAYALRDGRGGFDLRYFDHLIVEGAQPTPPPGLDYPLLLANGPRLIWADAADAESRQALVAQHKNFLIHGTLQADALGGNPILDGATLAHETTTPPCAHWPTGKLHLDLDDIARGRCDVSELEGVAIQLDVTLVFAAGGAQ